MPPFVLLGLVGPAIALHNGETLVEAFPDRFYASPNLQRIVAAGKRGFYDLAAGRPVLDPEVAELFEKPAEPVVLDPRPGARAGAHASSPTRRAGCSTRASPRPRWTSTWR